MSVFQATLLALAASAGTVLLAPAVQAGTGCTPYIFFGARGSGELDAAHDPSHYGLGKPLTAVFKSVQTILGTSKIGPYGVHYPAISVAGGLGDDYNGLRVLLHTGGPYSDSVKSGVTAFQNELADLHHNCSSSHFVLAGYSQGAQVARQAIEQLTAARSPLLGLVDSVVLFGDPRFNAQDAGADEGNFDGNYNGIFGPGPDWSRENASLRVHSTCHNHDPICNISYRDLLGLYIRDYFRIDKKQHENYQDDADRVAIEVANDLGVHAPVPQAPIDIAFVIDSTGSMASEIADVKNNVNGLANAVSQGTNSFRFALADYKDDPADDSPYQSRVDTDFTTDLSKFEGAVDTITASGGGDTPESMYSGIVSALNLKWRDGVKKAVIVIGDAPGKDPEPVTGYTLSSVVSRAFAVDPAVVYSVPVGGADSDVATFMKPISDRTGGTETIATTRDEFVSKLKAVLVQAGQAPIANIPASIAGLVGLPIQMSATGITADPSDPIVKYEWNFGTGTPAGKFDLTTSHAIIGHAYPKSGTYSAAVRATTASGLSATATFTVVVSDRAASLPQEPSRVSAARSALGIQLTITRGDPSTTAYKVVDGSGRLLDAFTSAGVRTGWLDADASPNVAHTYCVYALNDQGASRHCFGPVVVSAKATTSSTPSTAPAPSSTSPSSQVPLANTGVPLANTGVTVRSQLFTALATILGGLALVLIAAGPHARRRRH